MIIATVKKPDGTFLDHGKFISEEAAISWFAPFIAKGVYGKPETINQILITSAILDENNEEISPAVYEEEIIPAEFIIEYAEDVPSAEEIKQSKITAGKIAREVCQQVLDLVAGYNLDRELTIEQITTMQSLFSNAETALRAGRPTYAKSFISMITPDEELVTEEMQNLCLEILQDY